jgi:hypothetical protein
MPSLRHPAVPYVAPFAIFLALLVAGGRLGLGEWEFPFRVIVLFVALWVFSRPVLGLRIPHWSSSLIFGGAVFLIWIGPDLLWPGYRSHWMFQNPLTGQTVSSLPPGFHLSPMVLLFRTIRAVILVPIIEELFWRGWLLRWMIDHDFEKVPVGTYSASSFFISAVLFASEHGPYWEVGLLAGLLYNWWIIRTRSLGDCILAHGVTNALLSAYVILAGKWEYWL